jgi:glycosyltransferase involved in cell wall biosynthesis
MIVVDKGSSDNTADLARNAGARVHSFSQCDQALTRGGPQWNCGGGFSRYQILPSSLTQNW